MLENAIVLHLTECKESSMQASARIARYLSEILEIPLMDNPCTTNAVKSFDVVFMVNSPSLFAKPEMLWQSAAILNNCRVPIYVNNDYKIKPHSQIGLLARIMRKDPPLLNYWTTVPNRMLNGDYDAYINWNMLTYNPVEMKPKTKGFIYYGALRQGREAYFEKYLATTDYDVTISTPKRTATKFKMIAPNAKYIDPFPNLIEGLSEYGATVYIEDKKSHDIYCSPANRFYECLSAGVAQFFDESSVETFKEAGFDITPYIVSSAQEISERQLEWIDIAEQQRKDWGHDYAKTLDDEVLGFARGLEAEYVY